MIKELSILMPTFNDYCLEVAKELQRQASLVGDLSFEIIVADDGSTNLDVVQQNEAINHLDYCRFIRLETNVGRAAIRNFLAEQARFEYLLFVDSGMGIASEDFISRYVSYSGQTPVYGGYQVGGNKAELKNNLRFKYETKAAELNSSVEKRNENPNADFHTSNFLVEKQFFLNHPLDTRFRKYGYEDVLWGKRLKEEGVAISHIDNPVLFDHFETNEQFMKKTEEGLLTLREFSNELKGYSRILSTADMLKKLHLKGIFRKLFQAFKTQWRRNLTGSSPSLFIFKIYKLGFYLSN